MNILNSINEFMFDLQSVNSDIAPLNITIELPDDIYVQIYSQIVIVSSTADPIDSGFNYKCNSGQVTIKAKEGIRKNKIKLLNKLLEL
jgi:hypothetical protein